MEKRILGKTGWALSVIGFGAIKLPRLNREECCRLLHSALDRGINFIDTADCYGDSEEKIGQALQNRRKEFYLATKVDERDAQGVRAKLERSLRRLRTDWIDLLLFHDVRGGEYEKIFATGGLEELQKAQQEGKIRAIGISIHGSVPMMRQAIESGAFAALMVAYSALDEDRLSAELLPLAAAKGVGLIAMKPLAGGRLGSFPAADWDKELFKNESPAQIALRYVISNPYLTCAIPGMVSLWELEENCRVGQEPRPLSLAELKKFMAIAAAAGQGFCRNCGYCLPCPEGIPIPDIFRFENYYLHYGLKDWAQIQYKSLTIKAEACAHCQLCLERCPFGVPVPANLQRAHRILTG